MTSAYTGDEKLGDDDYNYCVRIDEEGGPAFTAGDLVIDHSVFACQDLVDGDLVLGVSTLAELDNGHDNATIKVQRSEDPSDGTGTLEILDGFYSLCLVVAANDGPMFPDRETTLTIAQVKNLIGAVISTDD